MDYFFSFAIALSLYTFKLVSSTPISNLKTDEYALLAFKNAITSDPHALLTYNWSSNISMCNWIGVSCGTKHHRVTALNVSGFQLRGTIAPHLANLTFLQSIDISSNSFTGLIPSELSNLRRLKKLNVGFNSLASEIPSWLGLLSQLRHLYLNNNTFSGTIPLSLFNISRLLILDMGYNILDGNIPEEIANFSNLETLNLAGNKITGSIPDGIFNMSSLIEINMRYNILSGEVSNDICSNTSPKLKRISLSGNQLYGEIPANICKCRELEDLRLPINHFNGDIPREIGSLPMLRVLALWSNQFKGRIPNEVGNLTSLGHISLYSNYLTGSIPSSIFNLSALEYLDLSMNQLSGTIPSNIGKRFSLYNLQMLFLFGNRLGGEIPSFFTSNATKLTILELESNSFSGPMPNFGNLRLLRKLYIWGNQLTGAESPTHELEFLSSLTNCPYLVDLSISRNPLNGILPTSIGNLSTSLLYFGGDGCNIKGVIPSEIGNLSSLIGLELGNNQMTGFVPRRMGNLMKLQGLSLSNNHLEGDLSTDLCRLNNLETLELSGNMFTGPIPACIGEVKSLRELYLASNKLDSTIPSNLWNLKDLVILNLSSNYLSGQLPSQIGNLKQINTLDLSSNQFLGDIPTTIDSCESLDFLSLSNNKLQGSIPKSLGNVRGLITLDLSSNNLSGFIPMSLEQLRFLQYFNVSYNKLQGEIPNGIVNSTAQSFVHNSALCGAPKFQVPSCPVNHGRPKSIALIFFKYIVPPFVAATIVSVVVIMLIRRRKKIILPPAADIPLGNFVRRRISYIELVRGTSSFSEANLLGIGSFGSVYKATLSDGLIIAVKVFNLELEGAIESFDTESEILSSIRHRNLLQVIGCCTNLEFRALVLKYMPNGSLEKWLHSDSYVLDLVQRLNISIDVALALEYLHHGHTFPVVHCDIKPSNVLLDEDMTAHVGDFGISKLFDEGEVMTHTTTLATIGYAAPEYGSEGKVSTNGDVYSYGILVLEMFTQKKPTDDMFSEEMSLKDWVSHALVCNAISEIVAHPAGLVSREDEDECVSSILGMAMKCLALSPYDRIDMIQVGAHLRKIKDKVTASVEVNNRRRR
ncbi:hypothetical protein ACS0TY_027131 [Phlomoides rotata]